MRDGMVDASRNVAKQTRRESAGRVGRWRVCCEDKGSLSILQ